MAYRHGASTFILTSLTIFGTSCDDVYITETFSIGDIDANAVQASQLVCTIPQGIQPELAIEVEIFKWLGERVESQATAYRAIVFRALGRVEACKVAAYHDLFHHL